MNVLGVDGPVYKFIVRLWDVIKLSVLWIVFSIPIVTLGGATIAVFDVTLKMVDDREGYVAHQFVKAFRLHFKNGIKYGILMIFCMYVVWLDFSLFEQIEGNPIILLFAGFISGFIFLFAFLFAFPLQARYENGFLETLKNSARISTHFYFRTLSLIFVLIIEVIIILWNQTTMILGLLMGPGCIMLTISGYAGYYFRILEKEPGAVIIQETEKED